MNKNDNKNIDKNMQEQDKQIKTIITTRIRINKGETTTMKQ